MLAIAKAQHMDAAAFELLYRKAVRAAPYFEDVHFQHADYFRPEWYGSPKLFDSAVEQAVKATSARLGTAMYAKLHWDLSESDTMFTDGSVDWKRMKGGFEDALRTYPSPWTRSNYARLACAAKDSATLRAQMDYLGDQVRKDAWDNPDFFHVLPSHGQAGWDGPSTAVFQARGQRSGFLRIDPRRSSAQAQAPVHM